MSEVEARPGDIFVVEHQIFLVGHQIIRVVKKGKVMWEVQTLRSGEWGSPARRKIKTFLPVDPAADLAKLNSELADARDTLRRAMRAADDEYRAALVAATERTK